jgi:hypothetical protein
MVMRSSASTVTFLAMPSRSQSKRWCIRALLAGIATLYFLLIRGLYYQLSNELIPNNVGSFDGVMLVVGPRPSSSRVQATVVLDCPTPARWRIVVTGNAAYEQDFLNWWSYCLRSGLCEASSSSSCQDTNNRTEMVLYAEDVAMYEIYQNATKFDVRKAWEVDSKFTNTELTGQKRFDYSDKEGFRHLVSRRPSILLQELRRLPNNNSTLLLFMDLDVLILQDPRPYFQGDYDCWAANAQSDFSGPYNTGLLAIRPTKAMIHILQRWRAYLEKQEHAKANQKTFNNIIRKSSVTPKMLDAAKFPVGTILLKNTNIGPDTLGPEVVVFHNNFCSKFCQKPERAKQLGLWNPVRRDYLL